MPQPQLNVIVNAWIPALTSSVRVACSLAVPSNSGNARGFDHHSDAGRFLAATHAHLAAASYNRVAATLGSLFADTTRQVWTPTSPAVGLNDDYGPAGRSRPHPGPTRGRAAGLPDRRPPVAGQDPVVASLTLEMATTSALAPITWTSPSQPPPRRGSADTQIPPACLIKSGIWPHGSQPKRQYLPARSESSAEITQRYGHPALHAPMRVGRSAFVCGPRGRNCTLNG
jgi:hypothetical protein